MKTVVVASSFILLLSGCVSTEQVWVENIDGNQLKIMQKRSDISRIIHIENTNRAWVGKYSGGEEKVAERKTFLTSLGQAESAKVCAPNPPTPIDDEPSFVMVEDSGMAFGGGLLGYAIASAVADYKNLPTAMFYRFSCPQDQEQAK